MAVRAFRALIMGAPGCGKGTVSTLITKDFGLVHVSSGNILRDHVRNNTELGRDVKKYIEVGKLIPDAIIINLINHELNQINGGWLLDGFPRNAKQAEALHLSQPVDVAINLDVPFDTIIERIKGRLVHLPSGRIYNTDFNPPKVPGKDDVTGESLVQRDDDKPEVVLRRLETYSDSATPMLEFYKQERLLHEFHGTETKVIWPQVRKYLAMQIPICNNG